MIVDLLVTALIYSGPILIVRYLILKKSIAVSCSLLVAVVYGIIGYFLFRLLFGSATLGVVVIWSIINFYILSRGKSNGKEEANVNGPGIKTTFIANSSDPPIGNSEVLSVQFCHKCGKQLGEQATYCHYCGTCVRKV